MKNLEKEKEKEKEEKAEMQMRKKGRTIVKICGLSRMADIDAVNALEEGPDLIGFVFFPKSRRYIPIEEAVILRRSLRQDVRAAGVFVDAPLSEIERAVRTGAVDAVQLHGKEPEETVRALRGRLDVPIIKAFPVCGADDIFPAAESTADYLLFDGTQAGSGKSFDHRALAAASTLRKPYFIAGGLTPENVAELIAAYRPFGVDASSGVETDGKKDPDKIRRFLEAVRRADSEAARESPNKTVSASVAES